MMIKKYNEADKQLHFLSQTIAKANRTYSPAKADDSHTNLYFDPLGNRITGKWLETSNGLKILSINLENLSFEFLISSMEVEASVAALSRNITDIESELESLMPKMGLNPKGFTNKMHFEVPSYELTGKEIKAIDSQGIELWKQYRKLANEACFSLLGYAQAWEEIRIWPHHFDTGIYFKAKKDLGIGFGLAMEDKMAGAPYFYFSVYAEGKKIVYNQLPQGIWKWELGDAWKGAILSLNELEKYTDEQKKVFLDDFLKAIYNRFVQF